MRGAISKNNVHILKMNELYNDSEYIDYISCYNSIIQHIINPNKLKYDFDIFCHCQNIDLQDNEINKNDYTNKVSSENFTEKV